MNNDVSTNRLKIVVGAITFEIEGGEGLVREGMTYAKENILTEEIRKIAKQVLTEEEKVVEKPAREVMSVRDYYKQKNPHSNRERVMAITHDISLPELGYVL